jgi:hypothetical protein
MKARAIALAVPLALGAACTHTGRTASTSSQQPQAAQGAPQGGGATGARDPLMEPGLAIQGHGGDKIVAGRISEATGSQVTIETPAGDRRVLQIVPQTMVELDGREADSRDLAEGQMVRASFDDVDGQDVAVKIRAGDTSAAASDATTDQGTGTSSDQPGNGTAPNAPGTATPDAGWGPPGSSGNPAPPASPHW